MKRTLLTLLAASASFILITPRAEAHHGWADFNESTEVTLEGTVVAFHFTNPHCVVDFDVVGDKGKTRGWEGEFGSPAELSRKGWNTATLQTGDKMSITGHPAKDGSPELHVTAIRMADGRQFKIAYGK